MELLVEGVAAGPLPDGMEPGRIGAGGSTALHEAVREGHARNAAMLLRDGADWTLKNAQGKSALDPDFATLPILHRIRQEYQRLPASPYDGGALPRAEVAAFVSQLERDGILKVGGLVDADLLARMQTGFDRHVRKLGRARWFLRNRYRHYEQQEYWRRRHRAFVTNDALACAPGLLSLCRDPIVVETANHYLRKASHIKRTYGMRYLPSRPVQDDEQFGWHHDMEDRQLKLMVLLTDIGEADQYMTYVRGSHTACHPYPRFLRNALDFDYVRTYLDEIDIVKTTGRAGDVFFFDSNGMHKGNRSLGRVRDALFVEFTADRNMANLWGSALPRDQVPSLDTGNPLTELLGATPKWERVRNQAPRTRPTWADSLEDPSTWI